MKYQKDYYQILGVKPDATQAEIRKAYRRLAVLYHPDRNPSPQSTVRMQEINEAYDVVGDRNKRARYDSDRRESVAATQTKSTSHATAESHAKDSSHTEAQNLQQFFAEEESPWDIQFGWDAVIVALIFSPLILIVVLQTFVRSDALFACMPLTFLLAFLIGGALTLWKSSKSKEKENQCPRCGQPWAAERLGEKILGIFQRAVGSSRNGDERSYTYEKLKIHYKCKYCSYEWLFIKSKRQ